MTQYSSAADMHPGAPKVVEGNAALMDEREPTNEELRKIESHLRPSEFDEESYNKRHNLKNPYEVKRQSIPLTKHAEDAGNEELFSQIKTSGTGGNSGAVVSPNPFGGLSAYQDASISNHKPIKN
jgi:hypothetical protein